MRYFNECEINSLSACENGRFIANVGKGKNTLVDQIGRVFDFEFNEIEARSDGFFAAKTGWVNEMLIDANGNIVCKEAKEIDLFSDDGIALVTELDGSRRWLTKTGEKFGEQFDGIGCFSGGFGCVMKSDGKWTYVDKNLKMADVSFDGVKPFFRNCPYTTVEIGGGEYVINKSLEVLSGPYKNVMWIENNGLVLTSDKNPETNQCTYAYFSADGKPVSKPYKMVFGFVNGLCRVVDEKGHNFIDETGKEISTEYYKMAGNFGERLAYVGGFDENGDFTFTYMRRDGTVFGEWYPVANDETEGLISAMKGTKFVVMDAEKEKVISKKGYKRLGLFHEGLTSFECAKDKYTYMGHDFVPFVEQFDTARPFSEGFGVIKQNGKYDAITKNQIKLSELSVFAKEIEQNPSAVLDLPQNILVDGESAKRLCEHSIEVLTFAFASDGYDDGQKQEFVKIKQKVESFMQKLGTMSQKTNQLFGK